MPRFALALCDQQSVTSLQGEQSQSSQEEAEAGRRLAGMLGNAEISAIKHHLSLLVVYKWRCAVKLN